MKSKDPEHYLNKVIYRVKMKMKVFRDKACNDEPYDKEEYDELIKVYNDLLDERKELKKKK